MYGIVINENGYKVTFVRVLGNGNIDDYQLKVNEQVITQDWNIANSMLKPRWTGVEWIEVATAEEIAESYPSPLPLQPTEIDYLLDLDFRLSMIELGL